MKHKPLGGRVTAVALVGLLLASCGTIEKDKRALGLQAATAAYQSALRWGYFETAYGYLHPDQRKDKSTDLPPVFTDLRVAGYEVVQPPLMQNPGEAVQVVTIDYLYEDRQVVKTITDRQTWTYDTKLDSWWLSSGIPQFQ
ncbi:hypothetical protein [uncultured Lamprocystis sp.]|jgi:hypothetical protein|uniref:hypothetical protein n=1 Tax=uncultured Lamprocystis sp. TaxID=543132 RepID=UPI0025D4EE02|nr:hypothetical protein [uncultured Lamprocystis sp.]